MATGGLQQETLVNEKINADDREGDRGVEETPGELVAGEHQWQLLPTPALDGSAIWAQQARPQRWRGGGVRDDAVGSAGVNQKTPARLLIDDVQQLPGSGGIEPCRSSKFSDPHEQGATQFQQSWPNL